MRRVSAPVLFVASVLVLAFASSAYASHTTAVHAESATLGPGGSVSVSGTIECTAGYNWVLFLTLRQKSGKAFNAGGGFASGTCSTTGPETWTTSLFFGQAPFKSGRAVVETYSAQVCDETFTDCAFDNPRITEVRIRK
jgi:hypothetical protein